MASRLALVAASALAGCGGSEAASGAPMGAQAGASGAAGTGGAAGASGASGLAGSGLTPFPPSKCGSTLLGAAPAGHVRYDGAGCDCEIWVRPAGEVAKPIAFHWVPCSSPLGPCTQLDIEGEGVPAPGVQSSRAVHVKGKLYLAVTYQWLGDVVSRSLSMVATPDGPAEVSVLRASDPNGCNAIVDAYDAGRVALRLRGQLKGDYTQRAAIYFPAADPGKIETWLSGPDIDGGAASTPGFQILARIDGVWARPPGGEPVLSVATKNPERPIVIGDVAFLETATGVLVLRDGALADELPWAAVRPSLGADESHVVFRAEGQAGAEVRVGSPKAPLAEATPLIADPAQGPAGAFRVGCGRALRLRGGVGTYVVDLVSLSTGAVKSLPVSAPYLETVGLDCDQMILADGIGRLMRIGLVDPP